MEQLAMQFETSQAAIAPILSEYDVILVNTSGGKDSQTMMRVVVDLAKAAGVMDRVVAVHADLGRMEWEGTRELAEKQARHYGLPFRVESRRTASGDSQNLLEHVEARGMWPSSTTRYCTSDHKRGPIGRTITAITKGIDGARVLNCLGFRAEESPARAKRPAFAVNERASNTRRTVHDWLPIHNWTENEVWENIEASGVEHHRAYDLGMPRLSCVFCIFAPKAALILAGKHNRELLSDYVAVEKRIDHTFRKELSLADIQAAVEMDTAPEDMSGAWNM